MKTFWKFFKREIQYVLSRPRILAFMLLAPILMALLCGYTYQQGFFSDFKIGYVNYSPSAQSREVIEALRQSPYFDVVREYENEDDIAAAMRSGEIYGTVVIPADFTRDLARGEQAQVMLGANGTNMAYSSTILSRASEVLANVSKQITATSLVAGGDTVQQALDEVNPVAFQVRMWGNGTNNFSYFLDIGFVIAIVQQVLMYFVSITLIREKESGNMSEIMAISNKSTPLIFGKLLTYVLLSLTGWGIAFSILILGFDIPMLASFGSWLVLSLLFILAISGIGLIFSSLMPNPLVAISFTLFFTTPSFLLSGYTWPPCAMLPFYQLFRHIFPISSFAAPIRDMSLHGTTLANYIPEITILSTIALLGLIVSIPAWHCRMAHWAKKDNLKTAENSEIIAKGV